MRTMLAMLFAFVAATFSAPLYYSDLHAMRLAQLDAHVKELEKYRVNSVTNKTDVSEQERPHH